MAVESVSGGAAGESAPAVTARERAAHRRRNAAGAPSHTERLSVRSVHDRDDSGVAAQPPGGLRRDGGAVSRFRSVPPDRRRARPLRHGRRFRAGPGQARGSRSIRTSARPSTPAHRPGAPCATVRVKNVPRGTSERHVRASSLRCAVTTFPTSESVAVSVEQEQAFCPDVPRGTSSGARPSLSHPAAGCSAACAAIAASSALRMRAPISGGNRPCRTTVPSSSCQKVRPRFSCWASARSVSSARFARRYRRTNFSTCWAVPCRPMLRRSDSFSEVAMRVRARTLE